VERFVVIPQEDLNHINRLARFCARLVKDDTWAMTQDLESLGRLTYLEQRDEQGWIHWQGIKWAMQHAVIEWRFHMPYETWRKNNRPQHFSVEFNANMQRMPYNVSPERLLIAHEEWQDRLAERVVLRKNLNGNALKTHCPQGHELAGSNLVIEKRKNRGDTRRCRACSQERDRNYYQLRRAA
jgi:hypothetical protein